MRWNDEQIRRFEQALQSKAPDWDPDWEITEQLLKMVAVQARQLESLQRQVDRMTYSNHASTQNLVLNLKRSMNTYPVQQSRITHTEVHIAVDNLRESLRSVARGEKAAQYAGHLLKFVATVIV